MTPREWHCWQCGSRFATDAQGELVEYARTDAWCQGCHRLLAILQESALWHRAAVARVADPLVVLTPAQILARLRPAPAGRDYAKLAANDRDEE